MVYIENAFLPRENTFVDLKAELQSTPSATGSQVVLCYVQGQSINEHFIQILGNCIDYLHIVNVSELVWIVDLANRPSDSEQEFVTSYINTKREMISRVIFGSGQLEVATTISDYIEENLADIFGLIVNCLLSVGIWTVLAKGTNINVHDFVHTGLFQSAMNAYKREHNTADKAIAEKMETGEKLLPGNIQAVHKSNAEMALDEKHLSMLLRCTVLIPFSVHKYGIPAKIVNLILDTIDYEELFVKYLSQNSKDAILHSCSVPHKLNSSTCFTLGDGIIKDMFTVIQNLNAKCKTTNQTITVMKKMLFEVNSYLEQTTFGDDVKWKSKPPIVPPNLRKDLLRLEGVFCIGTVYNNFTIYLKPEHGSKSVQVKEAKNREDNEEIMEVDDVSKPGDVYYCKVDCRQQIPKIMKHHGFFVPYALEAVRFEPSAQMAIEDGSEICSPYHDELPGDCKDGAVCGSKDGSIRMIDASRKYRFGTLGGFVKDDSGNLFGLTCAHVVDNPCPEHKVYKYDGEYGHLFATSSPKMTFYLGENPSFALVDFAAVKVENDAYESCNPYIKDEDGTHCSWTVYEGNHSHLVGKRVYKYGAYSGLTCGVIACPDLELPCAAEQETDKYLIMIENLPDMQQQGPFSKKGDSGSLVCFQHVLSNEQLMSNAEQNTMTALSMIQCGEMRVYGQSSSQSLSFMLATGLRCLFKKSKVILTCVRPPPRVCYKERLNDNDSSSLELAELFATLGIEVTLECGINNFPAFFNSCEAIQDIIKVAINVLDHQIFDQQDYPVMHSKSVTVYTSSSLLKEITQLQPEIPKVGDYCLKKHTNGHPFVLIVDREMESMMRKWIEDPLNYVDMMCVLLLGTLEDDTYIPPMRNILMKYATVSNILTSTDDILERTAFSVLTGFVERCMALYGNLDERTDTVKETLLFIFACARNTYARSEVPKCERPSIPETIYKYPDNIDSVIAELLQITGVIGCSKSCGKIEVCIECKVFEDVTARVQQIACANNTNVKCVSCTFIKYFSAGDKIDVNEKFGTLGGFAHRYPKPCQGQMTNEHSADGGLEGNKRRLAAVMAKT